MTSGVGLPRLSAHSFRKIARYYRRYQKREKRDPILSIGNRESANGRKEKEVEQKRRCNGHEDGNGQTPAGRYDQNYEQKTQCYRRRIDLHQTLIGNGDDREN